MRINAKGQVTIPAEIRKKAGLLPHTDVEFVFDGRQVSILRKTSGSKVSRGARLTAHLRRCGDVAMNTDEIMALTRKA